MARYSDPVLVNLRIGIIQSQIKRYLHDPFDHEMDDPEHWKMGIDRLLQDLMTVHPNAKQRIDQGDAHSDHFKLAVSAFGDEWTQRVELRKLGRG